MTSYLVKDSDLAGVDFPNSARVRMWAAIDASVRSFPSPRSTVAFRQDALADRFGVAGAGPYAWTSSFWGDVEKELGWDRPQFSGHTYGSLRELFIRGHASLTVSATEFLLQNWGRGHDAEFNAICNEAGIPLRFSDGHAELLRDAIGLALPEAEGRVSLWAADVSNSAYRRLDELVRQLRAADEQFDRQLIASACKHLLHELVQDLWPTVAREGDAADRSETWRLNEFVKRIRRPTEFTSLFRQYGKYRDSIRYNDATIRQLENLIRLTYVISEEFLAAADELREGVDSSQDI